MLPLVSSLAQVSKMTTLNAALGKSRHKMCYTHLHPSNWWVLMICK